MSAISAPGKDGCRRNCAWPAITDIGGGERVSARALYSRVQRASSPSGSGRRERLFDDGASGSGLGVHGANRACGEQGQHRGHRRSQLATGKEPVPQFAGRMLPSRSMSIWTERCRSATDPTWSGASRRGERFADNQQNRGAPWKSRGRGSGGKPKTGFPPLPPPLGNPAKRRDSHFPTAPTTALLYLEDKTTKTPFGKPKGHSRQRAKPDRSRVNKSGQIDKLPTVKMTLPLRRSRVKPSAPQPQTRAGWIDRSRSTDKLQRCRGQHKGPSEQGRSIAQDCHTTS